MSDPQKSYDLEQRIIQSIQTITDQQEMLSNIVSILGQEFKVDNCLIIAGLDEKKIVEYASWTVDDSGKFDDKKIANLLSQPWFKNFTQDDELLVINDLSKKSYEKNKENVDDIFFNSILAQKTKFHGEQNGIVLLTKKTPYKWSKKEKSLLKDVVNLVAIACHLSQLKLSFNQDLTDQESSSNSSLTRIPKVLEDNPILKLWWGATRKQLDQQLEWNKQLVSNIITIMSDQTRNPLASIKMGITMLRKKEFSRENLHKRLDILEQEWQKLNAINEKILQLKTVKSEQLTCYPTEFNLKQLIEELATNYQQEWQANKRLSLDLELNLDKINSNNWQIYTDNNHLKNILAELLNNTAKFSVSNSTVYLNISQESSSDNPQIVITLRNLSRQVSRTNLRDFFEPFYREQWVIDTAIPGIGLGLTIVKELVELLHGTIEINNQSTEDPEHCIIEIRLTLSNLDFSSDP